MINYLHVKNFKSWRDTGKMKFAPLTGFFGTNSSGKTSIIQLLLLLKQTVESPDRNSVLNTGDEHSLIDLGTFFDLIHGHEIENKLQFMLSWDIPQTIKIKNPEKLKEDLFNIVELSFNASILYDKLPVVENFEYSFDVQSFRMERKSNGKNNKYDLTSSEYKAKRYQGRVWPLPSPVKCYGFPDEVTGYYQNVGFLSRFVLAFEELFKGIAYLGPLREYPKRSYSWAGEGPTDVGRRGESAIHALLSTRNRGDLISLGRGRKKETIEERIGYWLREMGIIHSYNLQPIAKHRKEYELRVKTTQYSPEVLITDVGFGVSQILPVLVLCYYMPEGSTIILEQPEIHLHPYVQAMLADVFIEVINKKHTQIIVESHSEHLLRRIQRRVAENKISSDETALYFCKMGKRFSEMERLNVDLFGNITNWPPDFFGNEIDDLAAMTLAEMERRKEGG